MPRSLPGLVLLIVAPIALAGGAEKGASPEGAGRVAAGDYVETDEAGVANPALLLRVREVTPNIVEVRGVNGWVTFAAYDEGRKEYRGFFEWQQFGPARSPQGKWADLFQVRLVALEGGKLHLVGKSKANEFVIRATPKP